MQVKAVKGQRVSAPRNMDHEPVWKPSTEKEVAHYDKLFRVVDRDKSGTLDGKEVIQFLSHSGLNKSQLKVRESQPSIM